MKLYELEEYDDSSIHFEKFTHRKKHKKPSSSLKATARTITEDGDIRFEESGLQSLYEDAYITDVVRMIRRGKEASVYLCKKGNELLAAKVYTDLKVRSFRNDTQYRDGRFIGSKRMEKAIEQHTRTGVDAQQALWIAEEFRQLKFLHEHEIPVPNPVAISGRVILMEFIGDENSEAARISEADLDTHQLRIAFKQSISILKKIIVCGRIHGDYSTFNLLWWNNQVIVIDFPQVVEIQRNYNARELLRRDVHSLCTSFSKLGLYLNEEKILLEIESVADWRK